MMKYSHALMMQVVYRLDKDVIINHKIIEMQFKILHRITDTNKCLHQIGKIC